MTIRNHANRSDALDRWTRVGRIACYTSSSGFLFVLAVSIGMLGCDQQSKWQMKQVPRPEPPTDYANFLGVSNPDSPNVILLQWFAFDDIPDSALRRIDQNAIDSLASRAEVFDCTPFIIDEKLKQAIEESSRLKWLRFRRRATPDDLQWIGQLRGLRGLSLRKAKLREADLHVLHELEDLQWLDLWGVELPPPAVSGLPKLPQLEVLMMDSEWVTDAHLPQMKQFPKLRVLGLKFSQISDDGLRRLVQANPELRYLNLFRCERITKNAVPWLAKLKQLEYLHVGLTPLEDELYDPRYNTLPDLQLRLPKCYIGVGD